MKYFIKIIVGLSALIIVLSLVFFGIKLLSGNNLSNREIPYKHVSNIDSSSWPVYINKLVNFSLRYPTQWKVEEQDAGRSINIFTEETDGGRRYQLSIFIERNETFLSSTNRASQRLSEVSRVETKSLGSVPIGKYSGSGIGNVFTTEGYNEEVFLSWGADIIWFIYHADLENETYYRPKENYQIVKAILSTFSGEIDIHDDFFLSGIPDDWQQAGGYENAINIVKYGSPAEIIIFNPRGVQANDYFVPTVTIQTFTIDERLSARDVANLIHDRKVADFIDEASDPCLYKADSFQVVKNDTYTFIENHSGSILCNRQISEGGISKTVIIKSIKGENALIATFSVSNNQEFERWLGDFQIFVENIRST